ncbi:MAG: tripartite tricarboxylate transporter substrate binding protein [Burkholderiales bacterium]|nr:tripartite tricarboxylate transporter substrate binding protein [Burkholderiales bacterium]
MNARNSLWCLPALASCAVLLATDAVAQTASTGSGQAWPSRPIRMIVPFAAGGGTDIQARLFSAKLQPMLGTVIVDNRPGGGGNIGAELVAKAPPDGYTVLFQSASLAVNQTLYRKLNYSAVRDLAPVLLVSSTPLVLVVHPSVPAKSVKELVALAKTNQGKLNYASTSSGTTSHLAAELFKTLTGTKIAHIPYKGSGPAVTALMSGEIDLLFSPMPPTVPLVKSGRIRALAVTTLKRSPAMPDVPTMNDTLKGFESDNWYGMFFPAGTSRDIINRFNTEMTKVLKDPDVRANMARDGSEPLGSTPEEFGAYFKREVEKYAKVIKAAGAQVD